MGTADRVIVMNRGEVVGSVPCAAFDRADLLALAFRKDVA
jgi:ABC-type sugar transport system ATPase subunit